ncbi:MBL fold metallo-hydrolase [Swingsia samuiensis]|uniref:MBL fold metallo-hydrolase n=1 Tax=Swingsia samuiensis TaxID=1293412 RepID=A0A4Y6UKQ2_9PROT|nr:MBL fold metallo-hydrolase [Swingsia samuiensis]QDH16971.1 MBL fold metallo-hydrolase [Swingsia samuiensis]
MSGLNIKRVPVTPLRQNCTIIFNSEDHAVVVDPGGDVDTIISQLDGMTVDMILLTHGHFDHAGGAAELSEKLTKKQGRKVEVWGPDEKDLFLLKAISAQGNALGLMGLQDIIPDRFLTDGEELDLLGYRFEVRHVPGHTPGHVVFIDEANGRAIVGDTLFRGTVGRTDFPYGDFDALISGIKKNLMNLPDETIVLCGHGLPTTIGEERKNNPILARY